MRKLTALVAVGLASASIAACGGSAAPQQSSATICSKSTNIQLCNCVLTTANRQGLSMSAILSGKAKHDPRMLNAALACGDVKVTN